MNFFNIYSIITVFYTLGLLIGSYLLYSYYHRLQKKERRLHQSGESVMQHAKQKSENILTKTITQAKQILQTHQLLQGEFLSDVKKHLTSLKKDKLPKDYADKIESWYQELLDKVTKEHSVKSKEAEQTIDAIATSELREFRNAVVQEVAHSREFISQKIKEEFSRSEGEIESYKKKKLIEIDEVAKKIVKEVTEYVIKKEINQKDQEKLIFEALQRAEKEGVFVSDE